MFYEKAQDQSYGRQINVWYKNVSGDSKISPEDLQISPADLQLVYNALGFKRRERDDVKKPGPRLDANRLKFLYNKNVTG